MRPQGKGESERDPQEEVFKEGRGEGSLGGSDGVIKISKAESMDNV